MIVEVNSFLYSMKFHEYLFPMFLFPILALRKINFAPLFYVCVCLLKKNFFFNVYLFLRQRERQHEQGRGRERETQNVKQAPGSELSAQSPTQGSNSGTVGS